jgi:hypothetical protein
MVAIGVVIGVVVLLPLFDGDIALMPTLVGGALSSVTLWFGLQTWRAEGSTRRPRLVLRADSLVVEDDGLFHDPQPIARDLVDQVTVGAGVAGWLEEARTERNLFGQSLEWGTLLYDEDPNLLLELREPVHLGRVRATVGRSRGQHRVLLPMRDEPVHRLWMAVEDESAAVASLRAWGAGVDTISAGAPAPRFDHPGGPLDDGS